MSQYEDIAESMQILFEALLTRRLTKTVANFLWTLFCDLKHVGFTEEQALALCKIPDMKSS